MAPIGGCVMRSLKGVFMKRAFPMFLASMMTAAATGAWAQETSPRAPSFEVTINPGGVTIIAEGSDTGEPSFVNYEAGAAIALNLGTRFSHSSTEPRDHAG